MPGKALSEFKAKSKLEKLTTVLMWIVCLYFGALLIGYFGTALIQTLFFHVPIEYRDMSTLSAAKAFSEWKNPYSIEYNQSLNTPIAYQYTFVVPLIIAMIHKITYLDFVSSALVMNYTFITITIIFIYYLLKKLCNISRLYILPIAYFTICGFSMFVDQAPGFTARGDALGIAILAIIYYLVANHKEKVVLIAFLSAFLFYAKSTEVFLALPVFVFYIIDNWKNAIKYFVWCILFGGVSLILVRLMFPLFFVENIYYLLGGVLDRGDIAVAKENYEFFWNSNIVITSLYRLGIAALLIKFVLSIVYDGFKAFWKKYSFISMMLFAALIYPVILDLFKASYTIIDGYKYCNSLLFEPVMVVAVYFFYTLINDAPHWLLPELDKDNIKLKNTVVNITGVVLTAFLCNACFVKYVWELPSMENLREWKSAYELVSSYDIDKIYMGPMISLYALDADDGLDVAYYDNGHSEYNGSENANMQLSQISNYKDFFLFNTVDAEDEMMRSYNEDVNNRIDEGYFDLIVVPRFGTVFIDIDELNENDKYEKIGEIHLTSFINECYYGVYVRH